MSNEFGVEPIEYSNVLQVQNPVENVTLVPSRYVALPPGELRFTLKTAADVPEPTGPLVVAVQYGDSHSATHTRDTARHLDFVYTYAKAGVYSLRVDISNEVSSQELEEPVEVLDTITGVSFMAFHDGQLLIPDIDVLTVFQNEAIVFLPSCRTGTNVTYKWTFGDNSVTESMPGKTTHLFWKAGQSSLELTASNALNRDVSVSMKLFVKPTLEVKTVVCPDSVITTTELVFDVILVSPVQRLCVRFILDGVDGKFVFWRGASLGICREVLPPDFGFNPAKLNFTTLQKDDVHLPFVQKMTNLGTNKLTVDLYSDGVALAVERVFTVGPMICKKPVMRLKERLGSSPDTPRLVERGSQQNLSPSLFTIKINCSTHKKVQSSWDLFTYDATNETAVTERLPLETVGAAVVAGEFIVPPGALDYGMYIYRIKVAMMNIDNKRGYGVMYVKVIKGPLKVNILYNSRRVVGDSQVISMDAVSVTFDPDVPEDKTGMTFTWFCRRVGETPVETQDDYRTVSLPSTGEYYFTGLSTHHW